MFVAGFIGSPAMNFVGGSIAARANAQTIGVRPEHLAVAREGAWSGTVSHAEHLGADTMLYVDVPEIGLVTARILGDVNHDVGDTVGLTPQDGKVYRFDATRTRSRPEAGGDRSKGRRLPRPNRVPFFPGPGKVAPRSGDGWGMPRPDKDTSRSAGPHPSRPAVDPPSPSLGREGAPSFPAPGKVAPRSGDGWGMPRPDKDTSRSAGSPPVSTCGRSTLPKSGEGGCPLAGEGGSTYSGGTALEASSMAKRACVRLGFNKDDAMAGKRILVTGGAGFIGSHLCETLLNRGDDVLCVDNSTPARARTSPACSATRASS